MPASRSSWRRVAGPTTAARRTACGPRRRRTTTATSRSPTCRRCTVDPAWLDDAAAALPELPTARRERYIAALGLSAYDAARARRRSAMRRRLFEATLAAGRDLPAKPVANWVTGEYLRLRNAARPASPVDVDPDRARGARPGRWPTARSRGPTPGRSSRRTRMTATPVAAIVAERGFAADLRRRRASVRAVDEVLAANPTAIADYKAGKPRRSGSSSARS